MGFVARKGKVGGAFRMPLRRFSMVALREEAPVRCRCRPSVRDPQGRGDSWVAQCAQGLVLYHNNLPLAMLAGSPLERATFNSLLYRFQCHLPRG